MRSHGGHTSGALMLSAVKKKTDDLDRPIIRARPRARHRPQQQKPETRARTDPSNMLGHPCPSLSAAGLAAFAGILLSDAIVTAADWCSTKPLNGIHTLNTTTGACAVSAEISVAGSALTIAGSAATADTDVIDASAQAGSPSKLFNVASAASPAILILHDLHLRGGSSAIHVEGPHASCNLTGVVITGFSGTQSSKEGVAIMVKSGAQVHLSRCVLRGNGAETAEYGTKHAVWVQGAGSSMQVVASLIAENTGGAIMGTLGARMQILRSNITNHTVGAVGGGNSIGIFLDGAGTSCRIEGSVISHNGWARDANGDATLKGGGVQVSSGASLTILDSTVAFNYAQWHGSGVYIMQGSSTNLTRVHFLRNSGTQAVKILGNSDSVLEGCIFEEGPQLLVVTGEQAHVEIRNTTFTGAKDGHNVDGAGLDAQDGAHVVLRQCNFSANSGRYGNAVRVRKARVEVLQGTYIERHNGHDHSSCKHTVQTNEGTEAQPTQLVIRDSFIEHNDGCISMAAVYAYGNLGVDSIEIHNTSISQNGGIGVQFNKAIQAKITESRFEWNRAAGIVTDLLEPSLTGDTFDIFISKTMFVSSGTGVSHPNHKGAGIHAYRSRGGRILVSNCTMAGNRQQGVKIYKGEFNVSIVDCIVSNNQAGGIQVGNYGTGTLEVLQSLIDGNQGGSGLHVLGNANVTITDSEISGNRHASTSYSAGGGGVNIWRSPQNYLYKTSVVHISNSLIANNSVYKMGGGIGVHLNTHDGKDCSGDMVVLENVQILNNTAEGGGHSGSGIFYELRGVIAEGGTVGDIILRGGRNVIAGNHLVSSSGDPLSTEQHRQIYFKPKDTTLPLLSFDGDCAPGRFRRAPEPEFDPSIFRERHADIHGCLHVCARGSYGTGMGDAALQCTPCPTGRVCPQQAMGAPMSCDLGTEGTNISEPCQQCAAGKFRPSQSANDFCQDWSDSCDNVLGGTEYESFAPNRSHDRVCAPLTQCVVGTTFEEASPTATRDRNCTSVRVCRLDIDFEAIAPSETADRVCVPVTQCIPGVTMEVVAPTLNEDRKCANVTASSPSPAAGFSPSPVSSIINPSNSSSAGNITVKNFSFALNVTASSPSPAAALLGRLASPSSVAPVPAPELSGAKNATSPSTPSSNSISNDGSHEIATVNGQTAPTMSPSPMPMMTMLLSGAVRNTLQRCLSLLLLLLLLMLS